MEPKDWIAVAQVYATLAMGRSALSTGRSVDPHKEIDAAFYYEEKAKNCLKLAGIIDA